MKTESLRNKQSIINLVLFARSQGCTWMQVVNSKNIENTDIPELIYMQSIEDTLSYKNPAFMLLYYLDYGSFKIEDECLTIKCDLK